MTKITVQASTQNTEGLQVDVTSRHFSFHIDEPKSSGGEDTGMNPIEAFLGALGACKTIGARSCARSQHIQLNAIAVELVGELDTDGYTGRNPDTKVGFSKITCHYHIDADNTTEEIKRFVAFVDAHCPVEDTIVNTPEIVTLIN